MSDPRIDDGMEHAHALASRIPADRRGLVAFVTTLVVVLAVTSFVAGLPGLLEAGSWALLPGALVVAPAILLDGGLVVFSLVAVVRRARGEGAAFAWFMVVCLTSASVAVQVIHVLGAAETASAQVVAGAVIAGSFPALVFAATHAILDLAIAPSPRKQRAAAKRKPRAAAVVAPRNLVPAAPRKVAVAVLSKMPKEEAKLRAIELHASGESYGAIARETGWTRPAVTQWIQSAT